MEQDPSNETSSLLLQETQKFIQICTSSVTCIQQALCESEEQNFLSLLESQNTQYSEAWKSFSASLNRFGKCLEKTFKLESLPSFGGGGVASEQSCNAAIGEAISEYFYRKGQDTLGASCQQNVDCFPANSQQKSDSFPANSHLHSLTNKFSQLNAILRDLIDNQQVESALEWCTSSSEKGNFNSLAFALREYEFICLMHAPTDPNSTGKRIQLVEFAKSHLAPLVASACESERPEMLSKLQRLMTSILWFSTANANGRQTISVNANANNMEKSVQTAANSPYPILGQLKVMQRNIVSQFTIAFCKANGMSAHSALEMVLGVAFEAIPKLAKATAVMRETGMEWTQIGELPIEIPIPEACKNFHSVFVCPVLKVQTSVANPPMCLTCGHVICRDALLKLSKNNANTKIKCPYCPEECLVGNALTVNFG